MSPVNPQYPLTGTHQVTVLTQYTGRTRNLWCSGFSEPRNTYEEYVSSFYDAWGPLRAQLLARAIKNGIEKLFSIRNDCPSKNGRNFNQKLLVKVFFSKNHMFLYVLSNFLWGHYLRHILGQESQDYAEKRKRTNFLSLKTLCEVYLPDFLVHP